jgi:antitoxin CptB
MDSRRKRLLYVSRHRGMQETDLLLGRFAEAYLPRLTEAQLDRFEALLDEGDNDLFNWITGRAAPPPAHDHDVMELLKNFKNELQ